MAGDRAAAISLSLAVRVLVLPAYYQSFEGLPSELLSSEKQAGKQEPCTDKQVSTAVGMQKPLDVPGKCGNS